MNELSAFGSDALLSPDSVLPSVKMLILVSVLSLAPSLLMMTTCYVRMIVVLGLLRQSLGTQQFPPNQVLTGLSLFLTAAVMWPVWEEAYQQGVQPYAAGAYASPEEQQAAFERAAERTLLPIRRFMSRQIEAAGNQAAVDLFLDYRQSGGGEAAAPQYYEDIPLSVLLPAYMLSELKTAFLIGFQIYLPFVIIDLVVASVLAGAGLVMLPPSLVSMPFKLLLFVLIDGWFLVVEMLLRSVSG